MGERNTRTLQFFEGLYVDLHHAGASMASARGISIYFPFVLDRSAFSRELEFASATH